MFGPGNMILRVRVQLTDAQYKVQYTQQSNPKQNKNKSKKDNGYQIVLLAKNKNGYHNLAKMSSIAFVDGFYYVPRIDKKLIEKNFWQGKNWNTLN